MKKTILFYALVVFTVALLFVIVWSMFWYCFGITLICSILLLGIIEIFERDYFKEQKEEFMQWLDDLFEL